MDAAFNQGKNDEQWHDFVELLGFDPSDISISEIQQDILSAYEFTVIIWNDPLTRQMLETFIREYANSQHSLENAELIGDGFGFILTLVVARKYSAKIRVKGLTSIHLHNNFKKLSLLLKKQASRLEKPGFTDKINTVTTQRPPGIRVRTKPPNTPNIIKPNRKVFGDDLNASVEREALARIAEGDVKGVALSRVGVPELKQKSSSFDNFDTGIKRTKGIERFGPNKEFFRVVDEDKFIEQIEQLYRNSGDKLHPVMKDRILNYVRNNQKLELGGRGIPGTHAEVRAANQMLNQLPDGFDVGKIQVSTYRLQPSKSGGQGAPFSACYNCGGILDGFDILTGNLNK